MKKVFIVITICILSIGAGVYYTFGNTDSSDGEDEPKFTYVEVIESDISIDLMADGQVFIPIREYSFSTSGDIESIYVDVYDDVKKGDELAKISTEDLENDLKLAELNLENSIISKEKNRITYSNNISNYNYQLDNLKTSYEVLKTTYDNMNALSSIYSRNEIEEAKLNYENALLDYNNYESSGFPLSSLESDDIAIEKAKLEVENLKINLSNSSLTAISDGTVIAILGDIFEKVTTSQVIIKVEEDSKIFVNTKIQEIDITNIVINQKAYVEIEAMLGVEYEAVVTSINRDPIIDNNGIVSYEVTLELIEESDAIMDGMTVSSTFVIAEKLEVVTIPNKAVKKVDSKQVVNVMTGENTAEERVIITGLTDGKNVEVVSGLSIGEKLVYEN